MTSSNDNSRARAISKIQKMLALSGDNATQGEVENARRPKFFSSPIESSKTLSIASRAPMRREGETNAKACQPG